MKISFITVLFIWLSFNSYTQPKDNLAVIAKRLNSYSTYQTNCNYTSSRAFGDAISIESLIVTQKIPTDTLCNFYYNFSYNENFSEDNSGDFSLYFKNAVYNSFKGEIRKTSFEEKPDAFIDLKARNGYRPAIQRSPQLYYVTPYHIAKRINETIEDNISTIVQMPDTIVLNEKCLRFIITTNENTSTTSLELCFDKTHLYPVYYKKDVKSDFMNQYQIAYFSDTKVNFLLPNNYFSEENLLPRNWQDENISVIKKNPNSLIGEKAPDWNLPVLNSSDYLSNSDLDGKYILLEFTATWCAHCIEAAEMMNRLEDQLGDSEKLALLSLFSSNIDKKEEIQKFAEKFNLKSTILYSASDIGERYHVYSYPNFIIISPEGKVFMNFSGYSSGVEKNILNVLTELIK